ncbi:hypothetical protein CHARACLAT_026805 [Characodon lateralis]|uniref:Uncharacterized protein n=1 Tax=Characodon lateralis TaxID=208331 RepID=A0ABU7F6R4_9TELE|nr:hypothetical protein [Characodon lateralis]
MLSAGQQLGETHGSTRTNRWTNTFMSRGEGWLLSVSLIFISLPLGTAWPYVRSVLWNIFRQTMTTVLPWDFPSCMTIKSLVLVLVLIVFRFIRDRVAGAADSAETPRHPSPQTPLPAPPGGAQGVPRPAERHGPSHRSS